MQVILRLNNPVIHNIIMITPFSRVLLDYNNHRFIIIYIYIYIYIYILHLFVKLAYFFILIILDLDSKECVLFCPPGPGSINHPSLSYHPVVTNRPVIACLDGYDSANNSYDNNLQVATLLYVSFSYLLAVTVF